MCLEWKPPEDKKATHSSASLEHLGGPGTISVCVGPAGHHQSPKQHLLLAEPTPLVRVSAGWGVWQLLAGAGVGRGGRSPGRRSGKRATSSLSQPIEQ